MAHSDSNTGVVPESLEVTTSANQLSRIRPIINVGDNQTIITTEIPAPAWQHKFLIGRKRKNIKNLTKDLNTDVQFLREDQKIIVRGPRSHVERLKKSLECIMKSCGYYEDVEVDGKFHSRIVGRQGANLRRIKLETGTMFTFPFFHAHEGQLKPNQIRIIGTPNGVAVAKQMILERVTQIKTKMSEHYGFTPSAAEKCIDVDVEKHNICLKVLAPTWLHSIIKRRYWKKAKDLKIEFSFAHSENFFRITGPPQEALPFRDTLQTVTEKLKVTLIFKDITVDEIYHPRVIGKGGANVSRIRNATSATIVFPWSKDDIARELDPDIIRIVGRPNQVAAAEKMIMDVVAPMEAKDTILVPIDWHLHIPLIEKRIEFTLLRLGVKVFFPAFGERKSEVRIRGRPRRRLRQCAAYLEQMASDIMAKD